jgi:hypothetical protein
MEHVLFGKFLTNLYYYNPAGLLREKYTVSTMESLGSPPSGGRTGRAFCPELRLPDVDSCGINHQGLNPPVAAQPA